jgi:WD40 repeat protein
VVNGRQIRLYDQETTGVNSIAISPDGRFFAYGRSDGTVVLARMPTFISNIRRQGNQTFVEWEGGIGPYQLQQCMDLVGDAWQNVGGPTTNTSATVSGTHTQIFYRVQSLPSGP